MTCDNNAKLHNCLNKLIEGFTNIDSKSSIIKMNHFIIISRYVFFFNCLPGQGEQGQV